MSSIFISHNHRDKAFVRRLAVDLQRLGATVWVDEIEGRVGDSLVSAIQIGIASAEYLGVVLSPNSVASPWVQREVEAALVEEITKGRVKVLPLLLADCQIPPFLAGKIYADFRAEEAYLVGLAKLSERLGVHTSRSLALLPKAAAAVIRRFAATYGLPSGTVTDAPSSPFGTAAFKMRLPDGKGVIYCHASGQLRGRAFHVRKGIGWYYEYVLGGSVSPLGLPTSHEEMRDVKGSHISYFEGGYIEWSPTGSLARAIATTSGIDSLIGERKL